jgi:hypothetical protein
MIWRPANRARHIRYRPELQFSHYGDDPVTDMIQQASDDQTALAICFAAVAFSGLVMYFSHYVGRLTGAVRLHETSADSLAQSKAKVHLLPSAQAQHHEKAA